MKKLYMSTVAAVLTLIFVLAWQTNSYAAYYYDSDSTYIKGYYDYSYTDHAIASHPYYYYVSYRIDTYNYYNVKWWIKDLDTGVTVKSGTLKDKGYSAGRVYGLYGKRYRLYLKCDDWVWYKCDASGSIYNY